MIIRADAATPVLRGNCINLIITSPPYNLGIEYDASEDNKTNFIDFNRQWLSALYYYAKDDGRLCLNVPIDTNGGVPSYYDYLKTALAVGWNYKTTIVWNKTNIARRTAWGSWLSASSPNIINPVEMIAVLYKNTWKRKQKGTSTITKEEFLQYSVGVWTFPGARSKIHPVPFPEQLPYRCIQMLSYVGDVVLDPFVGSGTTYRVAKKLGRVPIGFDISERYCAYVHSGV